MAKQKNNGSSSSKMTFVLVQYDGDDSALLEGFKTISNAISRVIPSGPSRKMLASHPAAGAVAITDEVTDEGIGDDDVIEVQATTAANKPKRSIKTPEVLDLDFKSGEMPLEQFFKLHPTTEISKRYLMIVYWLKTYLNIEEFTAPHIYTAYRHMQWQAPKDVMQPVRDLKTKNDWLNKGTGKGSYKLNHLGEGEVMRIMGRAS